MSIDYLIQNVSEQCIPNLVAARTYKPKHIIWIYTKQSEQSLKYLQQAYKPQNCKQQAWLVDALNPATLQHTLMKKMKILHGQVTVVYHLSSGTKTMSLIGIECLRKQSQLQRNKVFGVVMDAKTQKFDVVSPHAKNNTVSCRALSLQDILQIHGSQIKHGSGRDMNKLKKHFSHLEKLRQMNKQLTDALNGIQVCSHNEAKARGYFYLRNQKQINKMIKQGLEITQSIGAIKKLHFHGQEGFSFQAVHTTNPIDYMKNLWMEDWVGAVFAKHDDGHWKGGYSGVQVSIQGKEADSQEFDFLGARKNHLVYWSCKNIKKTTTAPLFEIDALRDEVGGRDHHIAGLVHAQSIEPGLVAKAKRLKVYLVNVRAPDAKEQLLQLSGL